MNIFCFVALFLTVFGAYGDMEACGNSDRLCIYGGQHPLRQPAESYEWCCTSYYYAGLLASCMHVQ